MMVTEMRKIISWPKGTPPRPMATTAAPNSNPAAEDAPIDRPWRGAVKPHQHGAGNRDGGNDQPQQEHGLVAEHLREPAREAGDRKDAGPQREPSKHLNEAELALDLGKRTRRAVGVFAVDDLGGHGVGDHVLQHDADHDEELSGNVERILAGEGDPAAGGAGENDEPGGDQARADIDIGAALASRRIGTESTSWPNTILMVQGSVSHTAMEASSAGVRVSASLIQKVSAMVTSPSAP